MVSGVRRWIHDRLIARILQINDTPHAIALGAAIGMFLALTPTVGVQVVLAIAICTVIRANRIAAVVLVFVSNPVTMIPIYWIDYWIGSFLLGTEMMTREQFNANWQTILDAGMIGGIQEGVRLLFGELGRPMLVGGCVLGLIGAIPTYPITIRAVIAHRRRRDARFAYERLRELRAESPGDPLAAPVRRGDESGEEAARAERVGREAPAVEREESIP